MMMGTWLNFGRTVEVPCTLKVENTFESLHAHVELDGIDIRPGDTVVVVDAPGQIAFGERIVCDRRARILRAGPLKRLWTKLLARLELNEYFEVSFTPRRRL